MTKSTTRSGSGIPLPPPKERRRLREARSLSEDAVATAVGVTRVTVRSWETGRTNPRGRKRETYARLLGSFAAQEEQPPVDRGRAPSAPGAGERPPESRPAAVDAPAATDRPVPVPAAVPVLVAPRPPAPGPEEAFDALYESAAPGLVRQTYLLSGRRRLSLESVEHAFHLAWQRWPEVAMDRDPAGWVRAVAYEYAMSPWNRLRAVHRYPDELPADDPRGSLLEAFQELAPAYRRTLLLHDGLGLGLPETAAETEASTRAAANRLLHAREALAERLPELADTSLLRDRLRALSGAGPEPLTTPACTVRSDCERRARTWTRTVATATALIAAATVFTVITAPRQYEPPMSAARQIEGVPAPQHGPHVLTAEDRALRDTVSGGPERLVPMPD
ncbi:helix-turn-helix domain-containing protein [Streptomyces peucetius]|uniref:Helix-turn-helix domain-containing protein n=1 Tax=Streptomyces peucetius TaxID=1950 RepID=A0ABY6IAD4_STRPE|nr:helix-turn-helix domain-containing protein [Streptomyces peucetius]UYQ63935.1 helix-turn-helix domain-containing protein [Streptomyces peucetius]